MRRFGHRAAIIAALALAPLCAKAAALQAFKPGGATVLVSATTTAATVTLNGAGAGLLVESSCTVPVRVDITGATATTPVVGTPGSLGIPANATVLIESATQIKTVSVKVDSGSACNVEITRGEGMAH